MSTFDWSEKQPEGNMSREQQKPRNSLINTAGGAATWMSNSEANTSTVSAGTIMPVDTSTISVSTSAGLVEALPFGTPYGAFKPSRETPVEVKCCLCECDIAPGTGALRTKEADLFVCLDCVNKLVNVAMREKRKMKEREEKMREQAKEDAKRAEREEERRKNPLYKKSERLGF